MSTVRVSIGPGEVAGYFSGLKTGLDELQIPSEHFMLMPNKFGYQESGYFLKSTYLQFAKLRNSSFSVIKYIGYFLEALLRLCVFFYAVMRFNVFIFPGSGSFFKFKELFILKLLNKRIIVVYLGSDARPAYLSGKHLDDLSVSYDAVAAQKEVLKQISCIRKVEKYADVIVNHTATGQFFKRDFIRLNVLGMPIDRAEIQSKINNQNKTIRILHAPSRPFAKGSFYFRQVIEELRVEGYKIDFVELTGVPNSKVMNELAICDIVLDELYSDVPMAMFATEAALFSKPVIVGGYYADLYKIDNPSIEIPPSLYVLPSEIKEAIRKLIDDLDFRLALGKRANAYVNKYWNVKVVAQNYLRLIQDEPIPDNWICDPNHLSYYWGWGLSQDNWRLQVGEYVAKFGSQALQLDHHPHLKQKVLNEVNLGKA